MGIKTPDQRVRVFVSSTLSELATERAAARRAIEQMRLTPVMFELGARPYPPRSVYRSYLEQSDVFVGVYWQEYGWIASGERVSGLEDEYGLSTTLPRLIYVREPAAERAPRLAALLERIRGDDRASYKVFSTTAELERAVADDLAVLLTERFLQRSTVKTNSARLARLPSQATTLVGRDSDVTGVIEDLRRCRLVTVTGVGGVGKTRVAAEVAARVDNDLPDGPWWCELTSASTAAEVPVVLAAALGVEDTSDDEPARQVVEYLRRQHALLVLDNCEHVVEAAGLLVEHLLHSCPNVRILATSRERIAVPGEQVRPLRPLTEDDGRDLFVQRARAAAPDFVETDGVDEIVRRLDGIPLAIELAAARTAAMSAAQIAELLDERFRLLTRGRRTQVERHRTLRATVDWSYSLLDDAERSVFNQLCVFVGSASADSVFAVARGLEQWEVVDALGGLVAKSMVQSDSTTGGDVRYRLLETLRSYGLERLEESGEAVFVRRRHAEHIAGLAESIGPGLTGPDEPVWRRRLRVELDNLRAAVAWSLDSSGDTDGESAVRIVAALAQEALSGPASEVASWARRAVEAARRSRPPRRVSVLAAAAFSIVLTRAESFGFARDLLAEAERDGAPRDCPGFHLIWVAKGVIAAARPTEEVEAIFARAQVALAESGATAFQRAFVLNGAGFVCLLQGNVHRARELAAESLAMARASGNPSAVASAMWLTASAWLTDDAELALRSVEEGIALTRAGASTQVFAFNLALRAQIRAGRGEMRAALDDLRDVIVGYREKGDVNILGTGLDRGVRIMSAAGRHDAAVSFGGFLIGGPLRGITSVPLHELPARQRVLDEARKALGEIDYEAAWSRGAALSASEMTDYAAEEIDRTSGASVAGTQHEVD